MSNEKAEEKGIEERGVRVTWDNKGNAFVSMVVSNIPKKQFEAWMKICNEEFSGKRCEFMFSDRIKAKAYDALLLTIPDNEIEVDEKEVNELGLMKGGTA